MLALIKNGKFISEHVEGSRLDIAGVTVMPTEYGWVYGEYSLHTIQDAVAVADGKVITATTVDLIGGQWTYVYAIEDAPILTPQELYTYNADKRWQAETGGFLFNGMTVSTDDRSKTMLIGARIKADSDPQFTTRWKAPDGSFITLDATTVIAVSDAVLAHVDACFTKEAAIMLSIDDAIIKNYEQIDTAWLTL